MRRLAVAAAPLAVLVRGVHGGPLGNASWGPEPMKVSALKPENLLPSFYFMAGDEEGGAYVNTKGYQGGMGQPRPFNPPNHCPDEIFDYTMPDMRVPVMPYLEQDDWGCEREPKNETVMVLENDYLRAAITPQWGGKVWSLYNKKLGRHMFYNNPAHQPSNIGYRKAWVSGGAEWNWSPGYVGHSVFSEEDVFLARIPTAKGDVVRVWEFDRLNNTVWQVDIMLDGPSLVAHVTITNPGDVDLQGYWWTCVAMRVTPKSRVIVPAVRDITPCVDWPYGAWTLDNNTFRGPDLGGAKRAWEQDMSFLGNIPHSHDFFFNGWRNKEYPLAHISLAQEDGFNVVHVHGKRDQPSVNNGTKFFTWGYGDYGKFQCDFMSASDYENPKCLQNPGTYYNYYDPACPHYEHLGQYTELQVGPAHSQMHTFPVPKQSTVQWTEAFKARGADINRTHSADYWGPSGPVKEIEDWLASPDGIQFTDFADLDQFLEDLAKKPPTPDQILHKGQPWGALHQALVKRNLAPGAPFDSAVLMEDPRTRPWAELLSTGTFSAATLSRIPVSFQVSDAWDALLRSSAEAHATWLHHLHLGTAALERGEKDAAVAHFNQSFQLKPNPHAARNLAVTAAGQAAQLAYYQKAWEAWKQWPSADAARARLGRNLASEIAIWEAVNSEWAALRALLADIASLCPGCGSADRVLDAQATLMIHDGDYESAFKLITTHCFPTYGRDRTRIIALWYQAHQQMEAVRLGRNLTRMDTVRLRRKIGCDGDSTTRDWQSPCLRGPPNIGIAY
eukprot:TRINITY_DN69916_c0_g1_i1.p1 TRINITY_DN69916_c0_g1~~TRINITY_DN69916_c0_g1_i1.p1  ORF type:complete len:812 (+),score=297.14 TRINITY_DN69916_c0_g1_i1:83-2437(+)